MAAEAEEEKAMLDSIAGASSSRSPSSDKEAANVVEKEDSDGGDGGVRMKKELGLLEGVAIILGIIIGSGENRE
jgi:hypothetical protein